MDPFVVLDVSPNASKDEIKAAFKAKCLLYHPDRPGGGDSAKFRDVKTAYEKILNKEYEHFQASPTSSNSHLYMDRCKYYREQINIAELGIPLDDPYPNINSQLSVLWKLIFRRTKLTRSINAKTQSDLSWSLSYFISTAAQYIPIDSPAAEALVRLGNIVRWCGAITIIYSLLDHFQDSSEVSKAFRQSIERRLKLALDDIRDEYQYNQDFMSTNIIELYPLTITLMGSRSDFLIVEEEIVKQFPHLAVKTLRLQQ